MYRRKERPRSLPAKFQHRYNSPELCGPVLAGGHALLDVLAHPERQVLVPKEAVQERAGGSETDVDVTTARRAFASEPQGQDHCRSSTTQTCCSPGLLGQPSRGRGRIRGRHAPTFGEGSFQRLGSFGGREPSASVPVANASSCECSAGDFRCCAGDTTCSAARDGPVAEGARVLSATSRVDTAKLFVTTLVRARGSRRGRRWATPSRPSRRSWTT